MSKETAEQKKPEWTIRQDVGPLQKKKLRQILRESSMSPVRISMMLADALDEHGKIDPKTGDKSLSSRHMIEVFDNLPWEFQVLALQYGIKELHDKDEEFIGDMDDTDILLMASAVYMEVFQAASVEKKSV